MHIHRKIFLLALLAVAFVHGHTQQSAAIDTLKAHLTRAITDEEKVAVLDHLARGLMGSDLKEAEKYGNQIILVAEESRNRYLMIKAYRSNGLRCGYFGGRKDYLKRSIEYYNKALEIARKEKIEEEVGGILLDLAAIHLLIPDKDKSLSLVNEAFSLISTLSNDSLEIEAHNTYGRVYLSRNDKILSLRNYLTALRMAEEMKEEKDNEKKKKAVLLRNCYMLLSNFYSAIEDYDKAIDYYTKAYKKLDATGAQNIPYQRVIDINSLGNLFSAKKSYDIAIGYFERSLKMADSVKLPTLKIPSYVSLLTQYLKINEPQKALEYMNSVPGQALKNYMATMGFTGMIDEVFAVIYTYLNKFDSARFYFNRALPYFEKSTNEKSKVDVYNELARFYKKAGEYDSAIVYFQKVKEAGERLGLLENVKGAAKELDSLYIRKSNYPLANMYKGIYYQYRDSIEKLNKEKELTQVEAADELQRQERLAKEKIERDRRRNNIQYMAITLGIVAFFVVLVVLGMFKVSATTIKMLGFFAFLMFFEFIFLLFKKNIYSITKGEPWKDLLFMIGLAALLLPLHHWIEEKVIKYLTSHNRLTSAGHHIKNRLFRRGKEREI